MRRKARPGGGRQAELTVDALGGRGDGVAQLEGRPVFVPLALPGERVRVRLTGERAGGFKAELLELLEPAAERIEAPCPNFGPCGGCTLQHLEEERYRAWKQGLVGQALARRGLSGEVVGPLVSIPPGTRRRASLAALRRGAGVLLGFRGRESHRVVDAAGCLLLTPGLMALLPPLRETLAGVLEDREAVQLTVSETEAGPDLLLVSPRAPDLAAREALVALAERADLARLSWGPPGEEPEPLALRKPPRVVLGGVAVEPPPGGFLQPSAEGEAALRRLVLASLPEGSDRILELFAGCGSFTFALAGRGRVHAVEGDEAALAALWAAARHAGLAGRLSVETRDLSRQPLTAEELAAYGCVVFDPPRAGAREQAERIAGSAVPAVVAVSCNPNSFARDARILVDGGYSLMEVTPVDQFPWSGHLELVASFRRR
jgi:23S rRNA (uracil1939-C5)-methyltransferase